MKITKLKMWVAAAGGTLTAVTSFLAAVSIAVGDDAIDGQEIISLAGALASLGVTVYGVWRAPYQQTSSNVA